MISPWYVWGSVLAFGLECEGFFLVALSFVAPTRLGNLSGERACVCEVSQRPTKRWSWASWIRTMLCP